MAEGGHLEPLCHLHSVMELGHAVFTNGNTPTAAQFQRRLTAEFVKELSSFLPHLEGPSARWIEWMATRASVTIPSGAESWRSFARGLPVGPLRKSVLSTTRHPAKPFFMEIALDRGYYRELAARTEALPAHDKITVKPLVLHEITAFNRRLETRGRSLYGLSEDVTDTFIIPAPARHRKHANPATPTEADDWNRLYRLANRAIRVNPIGFGTVAGYAALRRVEIANLTTISEGIRLGVPGEAVMDRLITGGGRHV